MKIGLYLGVKTSAGGMFQYAEVVRNALHSGGFDVAELYADRATQLVSTALYALRAPVGMTRLLMRFTPAYHRFKRAECDVILYPAQETLTFQLPLPAIGTIHDLMHRYEPHFPEVSRAAHRDYRFANIAKYARAVLVDSEVGKQHVMESYGTAAEKIFPLPYIPPAYSAALQNTLDLPEKYILYPAQFWAHKNHLRLLEAAAAIEDIHLVFTGGFAHEYERVKAKAEALGVNVTFTGYVPQAAMPELFKRARAMVMPTFFGPTNIPPLEAMQYGCPVAVSRIYGMPAQLGDAALYFDPKNTEEMCDVLRKLWEDDALCAALKEKGREQIKKYTPEVFTSQLSNILNQL